MACGTPVAALDRGAVREVVDDGVTGRVFDDLDADGAAGCRASSSSIAAACASAPSSASALAAWSTNTLPPTDGSSKLIMAADAGPLAGRSVLAIFAHPDDESLACGGTLARLSDAGARVVLVCASHGEAGSISDPSLVPDGDLGRVRAQELARRRRRTRRRGSHRARPSRRQPPLEPTSPSSTPKS